jgi:hypothetical protein
MFENYVHTKEDLEAVEEALEYLERPELDFIFKDRKLINKTLVISYDSKELFIWTKLKHPKLKKLPCRVKGYNAYRIPHKIEIKGRSYRAWRTGLQIKELYEYLPKKFQRSWYDIPRINGGMLMPFVKTHRALRKERKWPTDPYHTKESYLATVIHEFGHVYYGKKNPWYYSDRNETIGYMKTALGLYRDGRKDGDIERFPICVKSGNRCLGETFAFCTEYYAASTFWRTHRDNIDAENKDCIKSMLRKEKQAKLDQEDSKLADPHSFAAIIGKMLLHKYPDSWPDKLIEAGRNPIL